MMLAKHAIDCRCCPPCDPRNTKNNEENKATDKGFPLVGFVPREMDKNTHGTFPLALVLSNFGVGN
jgi:hypothetical protein